MFFTLNTIINMWILVGVFLYFSSEIQGISVGVLLPNHFTQEQQQQHRLLNSTISKKYSKGEIAFSANVQEVSNIDSFGASEKLCKMLSSDIGVIAIFGPPYTLATSILESICLAFEIPYISTSWRPTPNQNVAFFMNFFPETDYFTRAIAEIIKSFGWKSFVVIYDNDDALMKFKDVLKFQTYNENDKKNKILFEKLGPGPDYSQVFNKVSRSSQSNIILDCKTDLILPLLKQAKEANLLNVYNNYFLTNLNALTVDYSELNTTANITTIRLFDDYDESLKDAVRRIGLAELIHGRNLNTDTALFYDALWYLHDTIRLLGVTIFTTPIYCNGTQNFKKGLEISLSMKNRLPTVGLTGPIQFDDKGSRIDFNIYVMDVLNTKKIATWFESNQSLSSNPENDDSVTIVNNLQSTKVIVSTRLGAPYLTEVVPKEGEELNGNERYEGYSLDLIAQIAKIVGFEFELSLTEDGTYGFYDEVEDRWTGLIGDILEKKAHLAIGDLTITQERQDVVDFSLPFMNLGISILYKLPDHGETQTFAFMNPFSHSVWMTILYSYIFISLGLCIVLRLSPDDWIPKYPCNELDETLSNHWSLKNSLMLTMRALTMQGSDAVPKGKSARLAVSMWWLFCLVITSSYIANLALMVNLSSMETTIESVDDLGSQTAIKYGMIKGGSTESFFKNSNTTLYQKMWTKLEQSPSVFTLTNKDGVERVIESNGQYAFFMESTQLEYEVERNCELKQVGTWLDDKSYGIAMPINAPYRTTINRAILKLEEDGVLAQLKKKWWEQVADDGEEIEACEQDDKPTGELSIENIRGLFFILGVGIIISFAAAIFEFLWNVRKIAKEDALTFCDAMCDEIKIACCIWKNRRKIV